MVQSGITYEVSDEDWLSDLSQRRQKYVDGVTANRDSINLDFLGSAYPDTAHLVYELLQNAEDAKATDVLFQLKPAGLTFKHNGRPFNRQDVDAITGIANSPKRNDPDKIGQFGIGFKAVYAYTETPHIWSPTFSFKIIDYVVPKTVSPDSTLARSTRFFLPFDSCKVTPRECYRQIEARLASFPPETLLFLSHIESIRWEVGDGLEHRLVRAEHPSGHVEIRLEVPNSPVHSSNFLRFTEPVQDIAEQRIAIAFKLEALSTSQAESASLDHSSSNRFRIIPDEPGQVAIYFTLAKETSNLRFHIHAPFDPDLTRSGVKNTRVSESLFEQLAQFVARSLVDIRDLGLLNRDFLAVLPNSDDQLLEPYQSIRYAIVTAMKEKPLTPTHKEVGHEPAQHLLQPDDMVLKDLLESDDLRLLKTDDIPYDWAISPPRKGSDVDHFLSDLDIRRYGIKEFADTLQNRLPNRWTRNPDHEIVSWMSMKSVAWHRRLYACLSKVSDGFRSVRIVRCSDNEYRTSDECYLSSAATQNDVGLHAVEREVYEGGNKEEQEEAQKFLKKIGVEPIDEWKIVKSILKSSYDGRDSTPHEEDHFVELERAVRLFKTDSKRAKREFGDYLLLMNDHGELTRLSDLFLDAPYLATDLHAYYDVRSESPMRLSDAYQRFEYLTDLVELAKSFGAIDRLSIVRTTCADNPHFSAGGYFRFGYVTGIDEDYYVPHLQTLLKEPTIPLARLIWKTLADPALAPGMQWATYRINNRRKKVRVRSQIVCHLRDAAWVPQQYDSDSEKFTFVHPVDASADRLPDDFGYRRDAEWLKAIDFGARSRERMQRDREALAYLRTDREPDWSDEQEQRARELLDEIKNLPMEKWGDLLADVKRYNQPVDLPTGKSSNPSRRERKVRAEARNAPRRETESRSRSVSAHGNRIREEARSDLIDLYTKNGMMICQACQGVLPFQLADGNYYFEAVELLSESELTKHHPQNHIALCPNHAAMFKHANPSKDTMKERFLEMENGQLEVLLAGESVTLYFSEMHADDLRWVIDDQDGRGLPPVDRSPRLGGRHVSYG